MRECIVEQNSRGQQHRTSLNTLVGRAASLRKARKADSEGIAEIGIGVGARQLVVGGIELLRKGKWNKLGRWRWRAGERTAHLGHLRLVFM